MNVTDLSAYLQKMGELADKLHSSFTPSLHAPPFPDLAWRYDPIVFMRAWEAFPMLLQNFLAVKAVPFLPIPTEYVA